MTTAEKKRAAMNEQARRQDDELRPRFQSEADRDRFLRERKEWVESDYHPTGEQLRKARKPPVSPAKAA